MLTNNQTHQAEAATNIDDLLLALDHQLIDLRHAIENRFDEETLTKLHAALFAAQATINATCSAVTASTLEVASA